MQYQVLKVENEYADVKRTTSKKVDLIGEAEHIRAQMHAESQRNNENAQLYIILV